MYGSRINRSYSCSDVANQDAPRRQPRRGRCNSWNGTSLSEKEEMDRFFLEEVISEEGGVEVRIKDGSEGNEANEGENKEFLRKAKAAILGGTLLGVGVVMIPLPGPGLVVMAAGGSVLAKEFPAAQRAMESTKSYCASFMGSKTEEKDATNPSTTPEEEDPSTNSASNQDRAAEYKKKLSIMGQALEDNFYKGFAKAYIGTEKASKKIGRKFEELTELTAIHLNKL